MGSCYGRSPEVQEAKMKPESKSPQKNEKGQILVILAIAIVAIFAFAGLAIDGNRIYAARRLNQSTADSAALAGAEGAYQALKSTKYVIFSCGDNSLGTASDAAVTAAKLAAANSANADNIILEPYAPGAENYVNVICDKDGSRVYLDVTVKVTTQTLTTLSRVINVNSINTSALATVRFYPKQTFGYGNTLVSLAPDCKKNAAGITFEGSSSTKIITGGIFSDSCIEVGGNKTTVNVTDGTIFYNENFDPSDWTNFDPKPQPTADKISTDPLPEPKCPKTGDASYINAKPSNNTLSPGNYSGISLKNGELTLQPGLYCLDGSLSINGGIFIAEGVTIHFASGTPNFAGNTVIHMKAPICESGYCPSQGVPDAIPGMLMYVGHSDSVVINGTSDNYFEGLIYAPKSQLTLNGTTKDVNVVDGQIIAYGIIISGNANLSMNQTGKNQYTYNASLDFIK